MTPLACISAAGDAGTLLLITFTAIPDSLWSRGLRQDEDGMARRRSPASVDEQSFFEYISTVFIPDVDAVQGRPGLETERAILLMDSAVPHIFARIRQDFDEKDIVAITFPAHTINLFQALDLVFFGAVKESKARAVGECDDDSAHPQITKIVQVYEQTATSSTTKGSFRKTGMLFYVAKWSFRIRIVELTLREKPDFKEVWDGHMLPDDRSRRRQMEPFAIISSEFLPAKTISGTFLIFLPSRVCGEIVTYRVKQKSAQ
jgi:hypothetical protein